uniref:Uncharacterized protein n=1 Tax=Sexangularia sp. CB-2014 TaxID=1486929 RepID=A0A7S1YLY2_9EUKA
MESIEELRSKLEVLSGEIAYGSDRKGEEERLRQREEDEGGYFATAARAIGYFEATSEEERSRDEDRLVKLIAVAQQFVAFQREGDRQREQARRQLGSLVEERLSIWPGETGDNDDDDENALSSSSSQPDVRYDLAQQVQRALAAAGVDSADGEDGDASDDDEDARRRLSSYLRPSVLSSLSHPSLISHHISTVKSLCVLLDDVQSERDIADATLLREREHADVALERERERRKQCQDRVRVVEERMRLLEETVGVLRAVLGEREEAGKEGTEEGDKGAEGGQEVKQVEAEEEKEQAEEEEEEEEGA